MKIDEQRLEDVSRAINNFYGYLQEGTSLDLEKIAELVEAMMTPIMQDKAIQIDQAFDSDASYVRATYFALRECNTDHFKFWGNVIHEAFLDQIQDMYIDC
jgi:hypothetical protein